MRRQIAEIKPEFVFTSRRAVQPRDGETIRLEPAGDRRADAARRARDNGDALHDFSSFFRIWSATRNACAAMVSDGFTAADVGRKLASITNRFAWS